MSSYAQQWADDDEIKTRRREKLAMLSKNDIKLDLEMYSATILLVEIDETFHGRS
jgi:hypothetical protein